MAILTQILQTHSKNRDQAIYFVVDIGHIFLSMASLIGELPVTTKVMNFRRK